MYVSKIPKTIISLVQPAVQATAARLFVLTTGRAGSAKYQPTVSTFYETGLVTALYEQLLMSPALASYEIRHEMPYHGPLGAPKRVDLWMRPVGGGYPHLVEAGDYSKEKIHDDISKMNSLNSTGANWFLAFFRGPVQATRPFRTLEASLNRGNGLDPDLIEIDRRLTTSFTVYRPDGNSDPFGAALIRGR
ncbi:MAG TPA: hypothetical protein ENJ16_02980 [Planctomycetaceae bacterium]|nr:hypothetical protein [Planctomycetaceae bacterium]